ncbi:MAG: MipA/OmpV family protein [Gemmatimonadaceae bacterium]
MRAALIAVLVFIALPDLAAQGPPPASNWSVTLGGGAVVVPRHSGSDEHRIVPIPFSHVTYRGRVYVGPSSAGVGGGLGAYVIRTSRFGLAAELGVLEDRPARRSNALAGTTDRDLLATAGASLSYHAGPVQGTLTVARGLNDGAGLLGTARLALVRPVVRRLIVTTDVSATFADARQMRREFGVTEAEAIRRRALIAAGDPRLRPDEGSAYRPDGGPQQIGGSVSLLYVMSQRWSVLGFGGVGRLTDRAVASPLVRQREQVSGGIGLMWRR